MNVHKKFVDQILLKRKSALRDLIVGADSLELTRLKPDLSKLVSELDSIFYTIEFLKNRNLIKTHSYHNTEVVGLFNGFEFSNAIEAKYTIHYWRDKLKEHDYSLNIEMEPGLLAFKKNNYKTDEQLKDLKNLKIAIGVGLGSAFITAIITAFITKAPVVNCFY